MSLVDTKFAQLPDSLLRSGIISLKGDLEPGLEGHPSAWGLLALLKNSLEFHRMSGSLDGVAGFCRLELCVDGSAPEMHEVERHLVRMEVCLGDGVTSIQSSKIMVDKSNGVFLPEPDSMFHKLAEYTVDPKGRVTIPKKFTRCQCKDEIKVVMTSGPEETLLVVEKSFWDRWFDRKSKDNNFMQDYFFMHQEARKVHPRTGRVLVTNGLRRHSGLAFGRDVTIFEFSGLPSVLIVVPTTQVKERVKNGCLSYIAQKLTYDLSFAQHEVG